MSSVRPVAGISSEEEALRHYAARKWSSELITNLDWRRIAEIARAIAMNSGFEMTGTRIDPEGGCEFIMSQGRWPKKASTVVRLTGWNQWMASADCLRRFTEHLKAHKNHQGIFIAPGGFATTARHIAQLHHIETIDAEALATKLNSLPSEQSDFYFDIGTAGAASTPSCPSCLKPLVHHTEQGIPAGPIKLLPDKCYRQSDIIAEPIHARRLEVLAHCEVLFLREVWARDIIIHGVASGDFICEGALLLNPGGVLQGSVAARSIHVRPGGILDGETRILEGTLEHRIEPKQAWRWTCENADCDDRCAQVCLHPH